MTFCHVVNTLDEALTFSRGQLYQAVSRCDRRICVDSCHTANVVYDIANYCSIGILCVVHTVFPRIVAGLLFEEIRYYKFDINRVLYTGYLLKGACSCSVET